MINAESDAQQWREWAMDHGINSVIAAFIKWRPELLIAKEIPGEGAFPSPRSWEATSNILALNLGQSIEREMILGAIGEGAAIEFEAYLRTARELPALEAIIADPVKTRVPKEPSLLFALVTALAMYTREHGKSAMRFVERMSAEYAALYVMDVRRGGQYDIRKDDHIRKWIGEHPKLFAVDEAAV
jgi:hypothetical protein